MNIQVLCYLTLPFLVLCLAHKRIYKSYKNVLCYGLNDLEWSKQGRKWIFHPKINIISGITLACRAETQRVRIFIMTNDGHIWFGNYEISGGVAEKHLGDFSCPGTNWQKYNEKSPQHHFVNGPICQVLHYKGCVFTRETPMLNAKSSENCPDQNWTHFGRFRGLGSGVSKSFVFYSKRHICAWTHVVWAILRQNRPRGVTSRSVRKKIKSQTPIGKTCRR